MPVTHDIAAATPSIDIDDCWNRIGVRGDGSCPELADHIHCRNCPVHAAAALSLLDRVPPNGYLADWTRHFAAGKTEDEAKRDDRRDRGSALIFRIGAEWLALPATSIQEVAELRPIHSLPRRRDGIVLGIANVRGEILICISLAALLGLAAGAAPDGPSARNVHRRLIVAGRSERRVVMPVDEVYGVERFRISALAPLPAILAGSSKAFTRGMLGWQERTVGYLDDGLLFDAIDRGLA
jgi:chemotaxis-related protein WspD